MKYKKTNPQITFKDFFALVRNVKIFHSLMGHSYEVKSINGLVISFDRQTTGKRWGMDLAGVHKAYLELDDFKTANFKPYVPRTHSPAMGLLLHLGLLRKED